MTQLNLLDRTAPPDLMDVVVALCKRGVYRKEPWRVLPVDLTG